LKFRFDIKYVSFGLVCLFLFSGFSSVVISEKSLSKNMYLDELEFMCYDEDDQSRSKFSYCIGNYNGNVVNGMESDVFRSDVFDNGVDDFFLSSSVDLMDSAWPMKCHDTKHSGRSPYSTADNNGAELWKFKADNWIEDGAVIGNDGEIYFGDTAGNFYALNSDGSLKWKYKTAGSITSSPALADDGTIYIGSWDHFLHALYPNGTLKWKFVVGAFASIIGDPTVAEDGTIYVGSTGLTNGTEEIGRIFAVHPDGTKKWMYQTGYKVSSSPAIADDGTVYIGSGDMYLYAMNPDGSLQWRFKTGHYIKGPPSIADDGTIYVGSYDDYLYALNPDGTVKWKCKVGYGTETNPSIGPDGTIYVGGGNLWAINPDGTLKWTFDLDEDEKIFQSSPAISSDGIIYVGTQIDETKGGDILAVNPDGTLRWRRRIANTWVQSSPCIGKNGIVYIGSSSDLDTGYLYAFGHGENVNSPPDKPTITGPHDGKTGELYAYTITATDPDGDDISYYMNWGDGSNSGWQGPYNSGTSITLSHTWNEEGSYSMKAKAKDTEGSESSWTTFVVTMPKNKGYRQFFFFEQLFLRFPKIHQIVTK